MADRKNAYVPMQVVRSGRLGAEALGILLVLSTTTDGATLAEVSRWAGMSERSALRRLQELLQEGVVVSRKRKGEKGESLPTLWSALFPEEQNVITVAAVPVSQIASVEQQGGEGVRAVTPPLCETVSFQGHSEREFAKPASRTRAYRKASVRGAFHGFAVMVGDIEVDRVGLTASLGDGYNKPQGSEATEAAIQDACLEPKVLSASKEQASLLRKTRRRAGASDAGAWQPPTAAEVAAFLVREKLLPEPQALREAEAFVQWHTDLQWKVGRRRLTNWWFAARGWVRKRQAKATPKGNAPAVDWSTVQGDDDW